MKARFQSLMIAAFVAVLLITSATLGGFALYYGNQSIAGTISLLGDNLTASIIKQLDIYLAGPANITRRNARNAGDLSNLERLQDVFWIQQQASLRVNAIFTGTERREFVGVERRPDGAFYKTFAGPRTANAFQTFLTDEQGSLRSLVAEQTGYDPRQRPWYQSARLERRQVWSAPYPFSLHKTLYLANSAPIFGAQGELKGVTAAALNLDLVSAYLKQLKVGAHGKILIIDSAGQLIATSTGDPLIQITDGTPRRFMAHDSVDPTVKNMIEQLRSSFGSLASIRQAADFSLASGDDKNYLHVTPYRLESGLNWLIIVDVSQQDFLGPIRALTRHLLLASLLCLLVALIISVTLSAWISGPIVTLTDSLRRFAEGEWEAKVDLDRADEIGELAASFNSMADQIKENFATIEQKIQERTRALTEANLALQDSENRFRSLADAAFEGICITEQGVILEVNSVMVSMFGYAASELIGRPPTDLVSSDWRAEVQNRMQAYQDKPYEVAGLTKDGQCFPIEVRAKMFTYRGRLVRVTAIRDLSEQRRAEQELKQLQGILPLCSYCKRIRDDNGIWQQLDNYLARHSQANLSHGICPECLYKYFPEYAEPENPEQK